MRIIVNWLEGIRNFTVGCVLYNHIGDSEHLKRLLAKGETDHAKSELEKSLRKIASNGVRKQVQSVPTGHLDTMPETGDAILLALRQEWLPLYQRMILLRHELDRYGSDNGPEAIAWRKGRASEVKQLEKQCMQVWGKRDHYLKTGKLPFAEKVSIALPDDPIELATTLANITRNIRRNKLLLQKHPGKSQYAQNYIDYKNEYKRVTGKDYVEKN